MLIPLQEKASCSSSAASIEVSNGTECAATGTSSGGSDSKEEEKSWGTTYRTLTLPSPQYVIYTDSELENVKSYFFQLKRLGRAGECELSKELTCRLIRNTITNMVSAVRALHCEEKQYPSKEDLVAMAKRLVIYYPMLSDKLDIQRPWVSIAFNVIKYLKSHTCLQRPLVVHSPVSHTCTHYIR